jgi:hypothetical protein
MMSIEERPIASLSANQDLLVRNEWRGVDVEDLVRAQLAPDLIASRIAIHAVSPPKRRGFSAVVMVTMAARSVDGTVDPDYASSGVTWRLTCRAAHALSPGKAGGRGLGSSVGQRKG